MTILLNLKGVTCFLVFFFQMSMQEQLRILNYNSATKKKKKEKTTQQVKIAKQQGQRLVDYHDWYE